MFDKYHNENKPDAVTHIPCDFVAEKHHFEKDGKQIDYCIIKCMVNGNEIIFKPCVGHLRTALKTFFE